MKNNFLARLVSPANRIFLNISSFQALVMFRRGLFFTYLSIYLRNYLGMTVTETTFFATFPMLMNVASQTFLWGNLSDKFQLRRTLIIIGEVVAAIFTIAIWYGHILPESKQAAAYVLTVGMTILEFFWSMSNVAWSALLSDIYPPEQRTGLQGRMASVGALGRFIGIIVGGLLYDGFGHHFEGWGFSGGALFFIAGGVMILSAVPMMFVPEGGVKKTAEIKPEMAITVKLSNYSLSKKYAVFLLAVLFIYFGSNSIVLFKSQYLVLDTGFNVSSRLLSYILSMTTVAVFIVGFFTKPLSKKISDETMMVIGVLFSIFSLTGYALSLNLTSVFIADFCNGVAMVLISASAYTIASKLIPPAKRGRQFALFNASMFLSWGLPGTLITGPLVDSLIKSGSPQVFAYKMAFWAGAGMIVIGLITLLLDFRIKNNSATVSNQA
jgi:MFS family permease